MGLQTLHTGLTVVEKGIGRAQIAFARHHQGCNVKSFGKTCNFIILF
jgi:hypothetical protein